MNNPKVSVIIPAYNVEAFIEKTIRSVLEQSFDDFEIIIINDGSTDKTSKISSEILKNSNVPYKIINQENQGVSVARNVGIANARGEYIKFLDGDDILVKDALKILVEACEKENVSLAFGGQDIVNSDGKVIFKYEKMYSVDQKLMDYEEAITSFLKGKFFVGCNSSIIKAELIKRHNIMFTPGAKYSEDNEFIAKCIYYSRKISYVDSTVVFASYRADSSTKIPNLSVFHNVGSIQRTQKFFERLKEEKMAKDIKEYVVPLSFAWAIGALAYNGYPYTNWIKIVQKPIIKSNISMIKFDPSIKNKLYNQIKLGKFIFKLSPTIFYIIMRLFGIIHKKSSR